MDLETWMAKNPGAAVYHEQQGYWQVFSQCPDLFHLTDHIVTSTASGPSRILHHRDRKPAKRKPELQVRMQEALGLEDDDFAYHATDLYVVAKKGVYEWLRINYKYSSNVKSFYSQEGSLWNGAGKRCFDIPFAGNWKS